LEDGAKMTIHTYGDSHAVAGWNRLDDYKVVTHHLGPRVMYSIGRSGVVIAPYDSGDFIVFCSGEIDCRCHINKYSKKKPYQEIIDYVVEAYIDMIRKLKLQCKVGVYGVLPPLKISQSKELVDGMNLEENTASYPFLGTEQDRLSNVLYMNEKLKTMCNPDLLFIDIYPYYADLDGFINKKLSDNSVHIKDLRGLQLVLEEVLK
jgi:hypothetical protein